MWSLNYLSSICTPCMLSQGVSQELHIHGFPGNVELPVSYDLVLSGASILDNTGWKLCPFWQPPHQLGIIPLPQFLLVMSYFRHFLVLNPQFVIFLHHFISPLSAPGIIQPSLLGLFYHGYIRLKPLLD